MKIIICKDYEEMSKEAAKIFSDRIKNKKDIILGLATGSTPIGMYENLVKENKEGKLDFSNVRSFNLDEYLGISEDNDQSYHYFMNDNLFSKVNIKKENTHFPCLDENEDGSHYDKEIEEAGGIDIQVLGIGRNGHIAFNEPAEELNVNTGKINLTQSTIEANSRFFESEDQVPVSAVSMGMGSIMKAKELVILASGKEKADAVKYLIKGDKVSTDCPVSFALLHPNATLIVDEDAAK